jgi:hypothetical protein
MEKRIASLTCILKAKKERRPNLNLESAVFTGIVITVMNPVKRNTQERRKETGQIVPKTNIGQHQNFIGRVSTSIQKENKTSPFFMPVDQQTHWKFYPKPFASLFLPKP